MNSPDPKYASWMDAAKEAASKLGNAESSAAVRDADWWDSLVIHLEQCRTHAEGLGFNLLAELSRLILATLQSVRSGVVDLGPSTLNLLAGALRHWIALRSLHTDQEPEGDLAVTLRSMGYEGPVAPVKTISTTFVADMAKYLPLFVEETEEGIEAIQNHLLQYEAGVKQSGFKASEESIDELFRHAHRIKASAAAMGFTQLAELTHTLEAVLARLREGKLKPGSELVSTLLTAMDQVRAEVDTAKSGAVPARDLMPMKAALMWYLDAPPPAPEVVTDRVTTEAPPPPVDQSFEMPAETEPHTATPESHANAALNQTIRVPVSRLDELMDLSGELSISKNSFLSLTQTVRTHYGEKLAMGLEEAISQLSALTSNIQQVVLQMRMVPIQPLFERAHRVVRDLSTELGKEVELVFKGAETYVDKKIVDQLSEPLLHLMRNCVDHGLETPSARTLSGKPLHGTIRLEAQREGGRICLSVSDDGRGLLVEEIRRKAIEQKLLTAEAAAQMKDAELYSFIFRPGFSTVGKVTRISGRGVGMDIVRKRVEELNGSVEVTSVAGRGTSFRLYLPLTVVAQTCLLFDIQGVTFAFPLHNVSEILRVPSSDIVEMNFGKYYRLRNELVPVFRIKHFFRNTPFPAPAPTESGHNLVVIQAGTRRLALLVDELRGEQEMLVKHPGELVGEIPGLAGVSVLSSGNVALILDVEKLVERSGSEIRTPSGPESQPQQNAK